MNKQKAKNIAKFILKLTISSLAVYLVYRNIDTTELMKYIKRVNWLFLLLAFLVFFISKIVEALRLNVFYRAINIHLTEVNNFKLYLLGMFYNLFLPGGIGGDSYKVYWLKKNYKTKLKPLIWATLLNRLIGMTALVLLIMLCVIFISFSFNYNYLIPFAIPVIYLIYNFILRWFFKNFKHTLLITSFLSIVAQIMQVVTAHFILLALGVNHAFMDYWFIFMVSGIAFAIPVTLGGVGSRELVFMYGARLLLIDLNIAIALSLIMYVIRAVASFAGVYYLIYPKNITS